MKYTLFLIVLIFSINGVISKASEYPSMYNVVWDSPSKNASGTMPIGNGDIGANVYAIKNGDLYLLLSKNDALTYQGDLFKTGRIKISFPSNPFKDGCKFTQTLDLPTGSVIIKSEGIEIRIWADAYSPVYHVDVNSKKSIELTVQPDLWERIDHCPKNQFMKINKSITQDSIKVNDNSVMWYYNVGNYSVRDDDYKFYDIDYMRDESNDPYRYNIFGNLLTCNELSRIKNKLHGKGKHFEILIHALTLQCKDSNKWIRTIEKQATEYKNNIDRWNSHKDWWKRFWNKSWICASNNDIPTSLRNKFYGEADNNGLRKEKDKAALVSQNYNVFRFLMACQSRGAIQTKFNGGIFTQQLAIDSDDNSIRDKHITNANGILLTNEDDRLWGRRFTWQNQRLLYWPLLASGDYDLLQPFFNFYTKILPIRREITKNWFGHEGAYFRENMCITGAERDNQLADGSMPEGSKPAKSIMGTTAKYYHQFYFYSGLEMVIMMLEYKEYTSDPYFTNNSLLPMAREVLKFYDKHYGRDENGKLCIDPSQVLETFWQARNPAPELSALRRCLNDLISLNLGNSSDKRDWKRMLDELPPVPVNNNNGNITILPAEKYNSKHNSENGELYPVFPAMLYGVGYGNENIVENTMKSRTVKDAFGNNCWTQDQIDWAFAGNAKEASNGLIKRFTTASKQCRFPLFGKENPDSCPDLDHFGSGSIALQKMLIQEVGNKIYLLPAWPKSWDVSFKLFAHDNTTICCSVKNGEIQSLTVYPEFRNNDIIICKNWQ